MNNQADSHQCVIPSHRVMRIKFINFFSIRSFYLFSVIAAHFLHLQPFHLIPWFDSYLQPQAAFPPMWLPSPSPSGAGSISEWTGALLRAVWSPSGDKQHNGLSSIIHRLRRQVGGLSEGCRENVAVKATHVKQVGLVGSAPCAPSLPGACWRDTQERSILTGELFSCDVILPRPTLRTSRS